jgi:uncharacterized protein YbjT (DUF2867 family)
MRIVVAGGTGVVGAKLVEVLHGQGHQVRIIARAAGVDVITRKGLDEILVGADVVIDVLNAPVFDEASAVTFFETSSRNLLEAASAEAVHHYLALSIVGCERLQNNGYFRAKLAQEALIRAGAVPFTILRSTQFFEFIDAVIKDGIDRDIVKLPPAQVQFIAADDVAATLADIAGRTPANDTIEVAGPAPSTLHTLVRRYLAARKDGRAVIADPAALYFGVSLDDQTLIADAVPRYGHTPFEQWLERQTMA